MVEQSVQQKRPFEMPHGGVVGGEDVIGRRPCEFQLSHLLKSYNHMYMSKLQPVFDITPCLF